jgi:hypothetical protein
MFRFFLALAIFASFVLPTEAQAGTRDEGELARLIDDLESLAERQVWNGVERRYDQIMELEGVDVPREVHLTAAYAARALGQVYETYVRLERVTAIQSSEEIEAWMRDIQEEYARVTLAVEPRRAVELAIETMPFDPDQRQQVETAALAMATEGYFVGMLPEGVYFLGGERFEVIAGVDTTVDLSMKELRLRRKQEEEQATGDAGDGEEKSLGTIQ